MSFSVLVLDANQRSALAVTRSLGRIYNYAITTADSTPEALAGHSKFSSTYLQSPSSESTPEDYINWISSLQDKHKFDLIIPVTEITSQLLLMHSHCLPNIRLPFASYETVMQLADKGKLVDAAIGLDIPCPQSRRFESSASLDIDDVTYPIVLKPCLSRIYTENGWIHTNVRILSSKEDLRATLEKDTYLQHFPFMLQEFIPGHGAGVFCLYNKGQPIAFFAHQRLREKPPQGGVSVLSQSVPVNPLLKQYATRLLDGVSWHGVAMVEYRITAEGRAYLMEVNTRFWGSLQLAIDSGVDFPALLAQTALSENSPQIDDYVVGQQLRWLLGDLDSLYLYLKSRYSPIQKAKRLIQFFIANPLKCRHEINRWNDLAPAAYELKLYLKHFFGR